MTSELLLKARIAEKNIDDIQNVLYSIKKIKLINEQEKKGRKPLLRFVNAIKLKEGKETKEATVILFDGVNAHGTDVPVDDRLLDCLKDYYEQKLNEAKMEFASL